MPGAEDKASSLSPIFGSVISSLGWHPLQVQPLPSSLHIPLVTIALLPFAVDEAVGEDLLVTSSADSGAGSLRAAIAAANANSEADTITFAAALRGATITLSSSELVITSAVTISGFSDAELTISGNQSTRILNVDSNGTLTIADLTLIEGQVENQGAGIFNGGRLTVDRCRFRGHSARVGAGIANVAGILSVTDSLFEDNFATDDGAGIDSNSTTSANPGRVMRCQFQRNRVESNGGAVASFGPFIISESSFASNSALMNGGAIFNGNDLLLLGCTFSENVASDNGGAIENRGAPFRIANCTFTQNSSTEGGAVSSRFSLECVNTTFADNSGSSGASAILFVESGNFRLANSIVDGGSEPQVVTRDQTAVFLLGQNIASGASFSNLTNVSNSQNILNETDPLLGPLADNGGSVATHRLAAASLAIDRGVNSESVNFLSTPLLTDARGGPRFLKASAASDELRVDLGALEEIPEVTLTSTFGTSQTLQSDGLAGNRYQLLTSSSLSPDSFTILTTFDLPESGSFIFQDLRQPQSASSFYRLRAVNGFE